MLSKLVASLSLLALSSCTPGLLYTDIVRPRCTDMRTTPIGPEGITGRTTKFKIPATRVDLSLELNSRAIGDIAKLNGLSTIYYCDQRTFSILFGVYQEKEIIVYGK